MKCEFEEEYMHLEDTVLIVTGCIMPGNVPYLQLFNIEERLKQYLNSILFYVEHCSIKNIIFCENSNYSYDYRELLKAAQMNGKNLEILKFQGDFAKVEQKGKGYGEGEILNYVFDNSQLIKEASYLYKVTGRLIIENIEDILYLENKKKIYFNKNIYSYKSLDTRFWGMPKEIYKKYFQNAFELVDDNLLRFLEFIFWDVAYNNGLKFFSHPIFPIVNGISGSTNAVYRENIPGYRRLFCVCAKLGIFNKKIIYFLIFIIFNWKSCLKNYSAIIRSKMIYFLNVCWSKIYHVYATIISKLKYLSAISYSRIYHVLAIAYSKCWYIGAKSYGKLRCWSHLFHVIFSKIVNTSIYKLSRGKHFFLNIIRKKLKMK